MWFPSPSNNGYHWVPHKVILHKAKLFGRMVKWVVKLSEYVISYKPRSAIKVQVLADFIAHFTLALDRPVIEETLSIADQDQ